ncbi:MAG: glutamine-hydrolyzing carbamoyl-phosphate synthase small subunit [Planctomycetota bacterium]
MGDPIVESRSSQQECAPLSAERLSSSRAAHLELEDGTRYEGRAFGARRSVSGEVVFATGMVGYPESLTDPSYRGQLLTLTYPLIGNYGVPARCADDPLCPGFESSRIQAQALVIQNLSRDYSHWNAASSLEQWLIEEGIPGIEGVDVRALTRRLRENGTIRGRLLIDESPDRDEVLNAPYQDPGSRNVVAEVSCTEPILHRCGVDGAPRVILVDCGAKTSIVRSLMARGADVLQVPWDHDFVAEPGDAVLLSNGPGDPKMASETVNNIGRALEQSRPLMGICLGNQLLALAAGFDTYKLDFGHRSQNQPCVEVGTSRCWVTSQNHGYAVDGTSAPDGWEEWFVNANDGSNEGIRHREKPFFSVQFHPEANPGPLDAAELFDRFLELVR